MGGPFTTAVVQLPQRFQTLDGISPLEAGIRLLPFIITVPVSCAVAAGVVAKFKIDPVYALLAGTALQFAGAVPLATLPPSTTSRATQYTLQVVLGFGLGINNAISATAVPLLVERKDIGMCSSYIYLCVI